MTLSRARDARARLNRRRQLLAAAAARLDASGYAATTMAEVAAAAGLAKGTTYLYFSSKEALFLELLIDSLEEWTRAASAVLAEAREPLDGGTGGFDTAALARSLAATVAARPRLVGLLALRHAVLEPGTDAESAERFEARRFDLLEPLAERLERLFPALGPAGGLRWLSNLQALAAGLADLLGDGATPRTEVGSGARSLLGVRDFGAELANCLEALLRAGEGPARSGLRPPGP